MTSQAKLHFKYRMILQRRLKSQQDWIYLSHGDFPEPSQLVSKTKKNLFLIVAYGQARYAGALFFLAGLMSSSKAGAHPDGAGSLDRNDKRSYRH